MTMPSEQRRVLLIDGVHYDRIRTALDTNLDFERLLVELSSSGNLNETVFYRDIRNAEEYKRRGRFLEWLGEIGVSVKGRIATSQPSQERYGANLVEMAVDAMSLCHSGDHLYLIAGDLKLLPLLNVLRTRGVVVVLISTRTGSQAVVPSDELITAANLFVDLADRLDVLAR